eukprot:CAMPEP_0194273942 /NCGR_PEP_ID=MMETSP0169-20130528/7166_1 /TAXON_ID=218684 /ORGANISM="Corethron pennatum, Strain L29A3" /LENGTH=1182 /DNA_ID=CAMNT_0039017033 /DNA_START=178 /DNA_END=3726 /DNA_ORIENTATION=-
MLKKALAVTEKRRKSKSIEGTPNVEGHDFVNLEVSGIGGTRNRMESLKSLGAPKDSLGQKLPPPSSNSGIQTKSFTRQVASSKKSLIPMREEIETFENQIDLEKAKTGSFRVLRVALEKQHALLDMAEDELEEMQQNMEEMKKKHAASLEQVKSKSSRLKKKNDKLVSVLKGNTDFDGLVFSDGSDYSDTASEPSALMEIEDDRSLVGNVEVCRSGSILPAPSSSPPPDDNQLDRIKVSMWHKTLADRPKLVVKIVLAVAVILTVIGQMILPIKLDLDTNAFRIRGSLITERQNQLRLLTRPVSSWRTYYSGTYPDLYLDCDPKNTGKPCDKTSVFKSKIDDETSFGGTKQCSDKDKPVEDTLFVLFMAEDEGADVITTDILKAVCEVEKKIIEYSGSNCRTVAKELYSGSAEDTDTCVCTSPLSVLSLLNGYSDGTGVFDCDWISDIDSETVRTATSQCLGLAPITDPDLGERCKLLKGLEMGSPVAKDFEGTTTSGIKIEFPFSFVDNDALYNFFLEITEELLHTKDLLNDDAQEKVEFFYGMQNDVYQYKLKDKLLTQDLILVSGPFVAVFLCATLQIGQASIAAMGMLHILLSMPVTYTIFSLFYGYFPGICFLSAFIILGIGVDDMFVYMDLWKQSFLVIPDASKSVRVAWVSTRAFSAMLVTSVTTSLAFATNAVNPSMPLRLFGIFMAILIIVDFFFVITIFPAVVVIFHRENASALRSCMRRGAENDESENVESVTRSPRLVETFLAGTFSTAILKYKWAIIALFALIVGGAGYKSTDFPMPSEAFSEFKSSHPIVLGTRALAKNFIASSDATFQASIVWGLLPSDTGDPWDNYDYGELSLDESFDITQHNTQLFLLDLEADMRFILSARVMNEPFIKNGMVKFNDWLKKNEMSSRPTTRSCSNGLDLKEDVRTGSNFKICLMQFMATSFSTGSGFFIDKNQDVRAYEIKFNTKMLSSDVMKFQTVKDLWVDLEPYMEKRNEVAGESHNKGFVTDTNVFGFNDLLEKLSDTGILAGRLSFCLVFLVLLLTTKNFRASFFAIVSIYGIISCVMSILILMGWEMGALESLCMSILAGASVDFIVHIGHSYMESLSEDRSESVRKSLGSIGISVVSAGLTTIITALICILCKMDFFTKFGIFLSIAMVVALIFAFFCYPALLGALGPERGGRHHRYL